jgi:dolichyl-phosphate-mannose--protein O-mannosyl transferase
VSRNCEYPALPPERRIHPVGLACGSSACRIIELSRSCFTSGEWPHTVQKRNQMGTGYKVKYGSVICLKHVSTGAFLKSLRKACCHPGTSTQQMVVASSEKTEDTYWQIKGEDKLGNNYPIGEDVADGHRIRLEHRSTGSNLHSHGDRLSPVTKQQEVTCYGIAGKGDFRDDWFVDIPGEGPWYFNQRARLVHADTNRPLHSHNRSDPIFTNGEQEVTCFDDPKWDDNDLWVVESTDQ